MLRPIIAPPISPEEHSLRERKAACETELKILSALEKRLADITDEPRWPISVPIAGGDLAFMDGQLVNTNTIKIALSSEYIVEYSAKQALAVADRRRSLVEGNLQAIEVLIGNVHSRQLPSDWHINVNSQVVDEHGEICYEVSEPEPADARSITSVEKAKHNAQVSHEYAPPQQHTVDIQKLLVELEAEEAAERSQTPENEADEETYAPAELAISTPAPAELAISTTVKTKSASDLAATSALKSALTESSSTKGLRSDDKPALDAARRKSVSFNLPPPKPEEDIAPAAISTLSNATDRSVATEPFKNPIKSLIVERPLAAVAVKDPQPSKKYAIPSESDEDDEWEEDDDDSFDEEAADIDDLLLQREVAMQYHQTRAGLNGLPGTGALAHPRSIANWHEKEQEIVPLDTSLATGAHTQSKTSRFNEGRMASARLIIPSILQQANLNPGDIIEDLPLDGQVYNIDEAGIIQDRIDRIAHGESIEDVMNVPAVDVKPPVEQQAKPRVATVKIGEIQEKISDPLPIQPETAPAPKRVSRFKAARMGA